MTDWEKMARSVFKDLTYLNWEDDDILEPLALMAHLLLHTNLNTPIPACLNQGDLRKMFKGKK